MSTTTTGPARISVIIPTLDEKSESCLLLAMTTRLSGAGAG
jgi:hypothetical protein